MFGKQKPNPTNPPPRNIFPKVSFSRCFMVKHYNDTEIISLQYEVLGYKYSGLDDNFAFYGWKFLPFMDVIL